MKKSIIKNVIALTFALGALVIVAGNVFGNEEISDSIDDGFIKLTRCGTGIYGNMWSFLCDANGYDSSLLPPHKCPSLWAFYTSAQQTVQCRKR